MFLNFDTKPQATKTKIKQVELHLSEKILHSKTNHKQDEKTTLRMGENICKQNNGQRINLQNIQIAPGARYQKNK